jgi:hypothetical protein
MSRLPGKKIDTWEWSKDRQVFKVDVRMSADSHNGGVHFGVIVKELDINLWNKDIDALKKQVFAELDAKVNMTWEPYLHIEVTGDTAILKLDPKQTDDYDDEVDDAKLTKQERREASQKVRGVNLGLTVEVQSYHLTTTPTGQKLSRRVEEFRSSNYTQEGWPDVGMPTEEDRGYRDSDTEVKVAALVPDSPANREALNNLSRELQKLIDKLVELCTPEVIQKTLTSALGTKLLTAGEPAKKAKKR